jgi:DNA-binding NarL/FixJ family response regulator
MVATQRSRGSKVLVISSDEEVCTRCGREIQAIGLSVEIIQTAEGAYDQIRGSAPSEYAYLLAIIDITLLNVHGSQFIRTLQAAGTTIMLLGDTLNVESVIDLLELRARIYLPKTITENHLRRAIKVLTTPCPSESWGTIRQFRLSPRQLLVVDYLVEGLSMKEVAARLGCSEWTVRTHWQRIRARMGITSLVQLITTAHRAPE